MTHQYTFTAEEVEAAKRLKYESDHKRKCENIRSGKDLTITIEDIERLRYLGLPDTYYENLSTNAIEAAFEDTSRMDEIDKMFTDTRQKLNDFNEYKKSEEERLEREKKQVRSDAENARILKERSSKSHAFVYSNCRDKDFLSLKDMRQKSSERLAEFQNQSALLREKYEERDDAAHWGRERWMGSGQHFTKDEIAECIRQRDALIKPIAMASLEVDATTDQSLMINDAIEYYIRNRKPLEIPSVEDLKPGVVKRWIETREKTRDEQSVALAERAEQMTRIRRGEQFSDDPRAHAEIVKGIQEMHDGLVAKLAATESKLKLYREILAELTGEVDTNAITEPVEPVKQKPVATKIDKQASLPRTAADYLDL
jgi:hypothetical protein